ncbi:MAG: hypothetical protein ACTHWW_01225 [Arthrobacter sp.]|uniref:hypothetical protein n=1 Tax=unclassified Arthrobacter TaxID=235627 RepID=UPI00264A77E6|nr:hypothetical protein [Micrococcaceae bacterium]MDN5812669.1 hypothetical protein [Micrococcaceae bacterium]MDN5822993.1 hypothetical protein [Micrococcaceae bacterium]MDN5878914.1 hypothetical protein [Micrococcaceae bacterium]MDN5886333.1 hypothetical protein [Micrococcaceae bacterium]
MATARVDADSSAWVRVLYDGLSLEDAGVQLDGRLEDARTLIDQFTTAGTAKAGSRTPRGPA